MKTKNEAVVKTIALTIDQIIFSNRNQAYGAYSLRKNYKKHLLESIGLTSLAFCSIAAFAFYWSHRKVETIIQKPQTEVVFKTIDPKDLPEPIKMTPPEPSKQLTKSVAFTPKVVEAVKQAVTIAPIDPEPITKPENTKISYITHVDPSPIKEIEEPEQGFLSVQESALFDNGDVNKFAKWIQKNIVYPQEAIDARVAGKVIIQFAINKEGDICDVQVLRSLHKALDEETINLMMKSPKWKPAKQNGRTVKQLFVLPISFKISD